jgi:hypothetical protein
MKKFAIILPLLLTACASAPKATHIDMPGADLSTSVSVTDLRPASEKENKIFSLLISSDGYGIYRKGDNTLDPPITQLFRRSSYERLGMNDDASSSITIHHLVVYLNAKSQLRRGAMFAALGGPIGAAIGAGTSKPITTGISQSVIGRDAFEKSQDNEYERAFFTEAENPQRASVFVIYIDATIRGKRVSVKSMSMASAPEGKNAYSIAVQSAIDYYLSQYTASEQTEQAGRR